MAITLSDNLNVATNAPVDVKYGPYSNTSILLALADAIAAVPAGIRYQGLTVGLVDTSAGTEVVEYWFKDGIADIDLVEKETGGSYELLVVPGVGSAKIRLTDGSYNSDIFFTNGTFIDIDASASPDELLFDLSATGLGSPTEQYFLRGDNTWAQIPDAPVYELLVRAPDTLRLTDGASFSDVKFVSGTFIDVEGAESPDQFTFDLSATGLGSPAEQYFLRGDNTWAKAIPNWVENPGINMSFNVCQPISTSTNWPDNSPGINWYFQAGGPLAQKWTPTANNPRVRRKDFLGTENSVDITTHLTAMSDNFNNIQWVLKIVDPGNPLSFTDLAGSLLPSSPAAPIITIGGSYGSFGPGWTENTVFGFDIGLDFFDLYGDEGQLELHIYNNGTNGSIITGCTVQFSTP